MRLLLPALLLIASGCAPDAPPAPPDDPAAGLRAAEEGFARSMAERDFEAFAAYVADEAVFLNGENPLRGKAAVLDHWKRYFETPEPPFSWAPDIVEVVQTGDLGATEGPVLDPSGVRVATFSSIWRRQADGPWRIVFDNGHPVCPPSAP